MRIKTVRDTRVRTRITVPCLGSGRAAIQLKKYYWSVDRAEFGKCAFGCGYEGRVTIDHRIYRHVSRKWEEAPSELHLG